MKINVDYNKNRIGGIRFSDKDFKTFQELKYYITWTFGIKKITTDIWYKHDDIIDEYKNITGSKVSRSLAFSDVREKLTSDMPEQINFPLEFERGIIELDDLVERFFVKFMAIINDLERIRCEECNSFTKLGKCNIYGVLPRGIKDCKDFKERVKLIKEGKKVDMILTDLPYGVMI